MLKQKINNFCDIEHCNLKNIIFFKYLPPKFILMLIPVFIISTSSAPQRDERVKRVHLGKGAKNFIYENIHVFSIYKCKKGNFALQNSAFMYYFFYLSFFPL